MQLVFYAIRSEMLNGDNLEAMFLGKCLTIDTSRHVAIFQHKLSDYSDRW